MRQAFSKTLPLSDISPDLQIAKTIAKEQTDSCRLLKSQTKVGCCVAVKNGTGKYAGCNFDFEFGKAIHAEESAINCMIQYGEGDMIDYVYLYCDSVDFFTPCGDCRDKIIRFCKDPKETHVYVDNGKTIWRFTMDELLPYYPRRK